MDYTLTIQDSIQRAIDRFLELRIKPQNEALVKQLEDEFVEEITRQEKEWVKERRVTYLWEEIHRLLGEAYPYMDLIDENENPKWLDEFIFEDEINPRFRKVRSCIFQINMWETKKFIPETQSYDIEGIKDRNNIREVVESYGIKLRRVGGGRYVGLCPFHLERTGSFVVFENKGNAHCYGCSWHGDVINFVMKKEGCDFRTACRILL